MFYNFLTDLKVISSTQLNCSERTHLRDPVTFTCSRRGTNGIAHGGGGPVAQGLFRGHSKFMPV